MCSMLKVKVLMVKTTQKTVTAQCCPCQDFYAKTEVFVGIEELRNLLTCARREQNVDRELGGMA